MSLKISWLLVIIWVSSSSSSIAQQHQIIVLPESDEAHFMHQITAEGDTIRFFGLGIYIDLLHNKYFQAYDFRHNRIPDDNLFNSLTSAYNLIYARFAYTGPMVRRPAFYDSLTKDNAFVMGAGHLPWYLRYNYAADGNELLSKTDQATLAQRIDRDAFRNIFKELNDFAGESNLIINLLDEPERGGYGGSWFYTRETLQLMYELGREHGLVSLGLGPVGNAQGGGTGNKLTWSLENPSPWFRNPSQRTIRRTSSSWQQILDKMLTYYDGTYDIIYLNSYAFQIADPSRTGAIVREMLKHPTINNAKPVLPWISTENFRYGDRNRAISNIRRQSFSSIANQAAGIMFYPDTRVEGTDQYDETLWEASLDLVKELNFFRPVLERGKIVQNSVSGNQEWIHYEYKGNEFLFLVNHDEKSVRVPISGNVEIEGWESGVWHRAKGEDAFNRFQFPLNLTFFDEKTTFKLTEENIDENRVKVESSMSKIGLNALRMTQIPEQDNIEMATKIGVIPGVSYEFSAWTYGCEASDPYLEIVIYAGNEMIQKSESTSIKEDDADGCPTGWKKLSITSQQIPSNATKIEIKLGVRGSKLPSTTWFDDINLRMR